jgi:hypothetical protein
MANYYTYGTVPDVDETVYGNPISYGGLGFLPDRGSFQEPYYDFYDSGVSVSPETINYVEPDYYSEEPVGALTAIPEELFYGSASEPDVPPTREDPGSIVGPVGDLTPLPEEPIYGPSAEYNVPVSLPQTRSNQATTLYIPPGLEAAFLRMQGQSPEQLAAKEQVVSKTKSQRDVLSELLKTNQFDAAFKYAKDNNVQNLLIDPNELKALRGPFSDDEMKSFFSALPKDFLGEQSDEVVKFDPTAGLEASLEKKTIPSGLSALGLVERVPQVQRAFIPLEQKKEDGLFENIIKAVLAAGTLYAGASALPGLIGGGSAAGAGGAGAAGAGTTGATAAGATGAATAAGGAAAAAPLAEVVITASKLGLTIPQAATLLATTGAGVSALGGGAAPTAPTTPTPEAPLDEVVVTGRRALDPALRGLIPTSLASTNLMQGVSDIPTDIYGQPEAVEATDQIKEEPFEDGLDEIVVTGSKYQPGVLDLATIGTGGLTAAELLKGFTEPTFRPYEELPPEGEPTEEVVVKGTKPSPIDLAGIGVGGLTAAQLLKGFTQPSVDPLTGELKEPSKTEQELDKIQSDLAAASTTPSSSFLKDLIDKYGSLENALKLLGALGSAGAGGGGTATSTIPTGGLGGALPKYNFARKQVSPDIDYYTYGFRPEATFFEDTVQLEKPTQPGLPPPATLPPATLPPATLPGEPKVMATGGLSGYAKGGSNKSRYVAGPGSGREDKIPALLSDGEYVIDAETLALLGDGSTKEGARRMDKFRANIRKHKGRALSRGRISPNAKSPNKYMGGGLT